MNQSADTTYAYLAYSIRNKKKIRESQRLISSVQLPSLGQKHRAGLDERKLHCCTVSRVFSWCTVILEIIPSILLNSNKEHNLHTTPSTTINFHSSAQNEKNIPNHINDDSAIVTTYILFNSLFHFTFRLHFIDNNDSNEN